MSRRAARKNKARLKILDEIKKQLILQAERWDRKDLYTPLKLEEMELLACQKVRGEFMAEKNNLEYELQMLGTDKKEVLIKLEKLNVYLGKADGLIKRHEKALQKLIQKKLGDPAAGKYFKQPTLVSVMVGE